MKRKEMKQLLEERIERISLLETRIDTMEQLVDGYRAREQSIIDTLHAANETAAKTVDDGKTRADTMLSEAKRHADEALADAQAQTTAMLEEANRQANEALASAQSESERILKSAEATKREYEQMVATFNTMLEQNAVEAEQSASRYAEFIKERRIASAKLSPDDEDQYPNTGAEGRVTLPDPEGDPARLMQNIYELQNRPIPETAYEGRTEPAAEQTPAEPAGEPIGEPAEPLPRYARHARTDDTPKEENAKPDYAYAFDKEDHTTSDAAKAGETYGATAENNPQEEEPEPFSESAWGNEAHRSTGEPQAEFTTAFDSDYPATDFSLMPDPACAVPDSDAEKPAQPVQEEPSPFSEEMWNHPGESAAEPQAEFTQTFAQADETQPVQESDFNIDETAEFAANYEAKFESSVNAADDEPREWEPDAEPDTGEVPSVADLVHDGGNGDGDDVSLDDLLDEIIKAGE